MDEPVPLFPRDLLRAMKQSDGPQDLKIPGL
jgi:hypothetical protein